MECKNEEKTILQLMEILSEKSDDSKLGEEFWAENGAEAAELANRLALTPRQAVLLSICLRKGPRRVDFSDIASHLDTLLRSHCLAERGRPFHPHLLQGRRAWLRGLYEERCRRQVLPRNGSGRLPVQVDDRGG